MFGLDLTQEISKVAVGIGLRISKVNYIIVVFEGVRECECIVAALVIDLLLFLVVILIIAKVLTTSIPALLEVFLLGVLFDIILLI